MSGQQIGSAVGGIVGLFVPVIGPQLGIALGGLIGGIIDPTQINGPKIGDGQTQTSTDGQPIAWILGTAPIVGTIVQVSQRRHVSVDDGGKGGPSATHDEVHQDFMILMCESCSLRNSVKKKVILVQQDGKIVYDIRPGSKILTDSGKWAANVQFLFGAEDQVAAPTMEAVTGVGNTLAYRGSACALFTDFNITKAGGRIPTFSFVVADGVYTTGAPHHSLGGVQLLGLSADGVGVTSALNNAYPPAVAWCVGLVDIGSTTLTSPQLCVRILLRDGPGGTVFWDSKWIGADARRADLTSYLAGHTGLGLDAQWAGATFDTPVDFGFGVAAVYADYFAFSQPGLAGGSTTVGATWSQTLGYAPGDPFLLTLDDVVSRICKRGGLTPSTDIDVSALTAIYVHGYPIARQCTGVDALTPLLQTYFTYGTEYDGKIHFLLYGADAVLTVADEDLLESTTSNDDNVTSNLRNLSTQFPLKMIGSYIDPAQNYTTVTVADTRLAIDVNALGTQSFAMPVVLPATDALAATTKAMKAVYAGLEGTMTYSVPFATKNAVYIKLVAGDSVIFRGKRWFIKTVTLGNNFLTLDTVYERQSAYTVHVQPIVGLPPTSPPSPYSGLTDLVPFNAAALRPQDTFGVYMGAASATGSPDWRGCVVQASYDGMATWVNALTITQAATMGALTADEPGGGEPLTVQMNGPLETVTDDQLHANANAFAFLHASGTEIAQFQIATEVAGVPDAYTLTAVSRAGLGTTEVAGVTGEPIVLLNRVYFLPVDTAFAGKTVYLRGVGFGEIADDATIVSIVYTPINVTPPAPPTYHNRIDTDSDNRIDVDGNQRVTY